MYIVHCARIKLVDFGIVLLQPLKPETQVWGIMNKYAPGPRPDEIKQCNTEVEYVLIGAGNKFIV